MREYKDKGINEMIKEELEKIKNRVQNLDEE